MLTTRLAGTGMLLTTQEAVLERPAGCLLRTETLVVEGLWKLLSAGAAVLEGPVRRYKEKERSAKGARAVVNNRNKKAGGTTVVLDSTERANVQL